MINLGLHRRAIGGNPAHEAVAEKAALKTIPKIGERIRAGEGVGATKNIGADKSLIPVK